MDHLIIAFDEQYINNEELTSLENLCEKTFALLNGYINYLDKQKPVKPNS
jgi:hypothetical protein